MKKILFVDDESHLLDSLRRAFRPMRSEWEMHFAGGVDQALVLLDEHDFDAVVTDIQMPVRSGFDLVAAIRSRESTRDLPVTILTGMVDEGVKRKALDRGAVDLVRKPFDTDELMARVRNMLRLKESQDELKTQRALLEQRVAERTAALEHARLELIWRLGKAGEFRDSETGMHVVRVGYYSLELARAMGLDPTFCQEVFLTSPLHDIGKIGIPDAILRKQDRLTPEEWVVMKTHTTIGAEILSHQVLEPGSLEALGLPTEGACAPPAAGSALVEMGANIARCHHERWDGSGYPEGLAGAHIPLEARIASFADVFDALSSERRYKPRFQEDVVEKLLREGVGSHFDPAVFAAFEHCRDAFKEIAVRFVDEHEPAAPPA